MSSTPLSSSTPADPQVKGALADLKGALRGLARTLDPEVEGHASGRPWSGEQLEEAVTQTESALAALRELQARQEREPGEAGDWSAERLRAAVASLEDAAVSLGPDER